MYNFYHVFVHFTIMYQFKWVIKRFIHVINLNRKKQTKIVFIIFMKSIYFFQTR